MLNANIHPCASRSRFNSNLVDEEGTKGAKGGEVSPQESAIRRIKEKEADTVQFIRVVVPSHA
jgi:hypothetical protein